MTVLYVTYRYLSLLMSCQVSLHNLFYLVRTRHPSNSVYFDTLVANSPMIRCFTLKNITDKPVTLRLTPSLPSAVRLFLEPDAGGRGYMAADAGAGCAEAAGAGVSALLGGHVVAGR